MVGWDDDSIGFHSDDGNFFYKVAKEKRQFHWDPHPRIATPWGAECSLNPISQMPFTFAVTRL